MTLNKTGHIPVDITFHPRWWHRNAGISFNRRFWADPAYRIEADRIMRRVLYEKFGHLGLGEKDPAPRPALWTDLLAAGFLFSAMAGCDISFYDRDPPEVHCANVSESGIEALNVQNIMGSPWWRELIKQLVDLENTYGYAESYINLQGIQNMAMDIRGSELFIDYKVNPELAHKLLNICTEVLIESGRILRSKTYMTSQGVTAIVKKVNPSLYIHSNCTVEMISNELYEKYLLEGDNRLSDTFQPYGIHHCGQTMEHVAEGYSKIRNLSFAEVGAFSDVAFVRKTLGNNVHLNLRYSPVKIKSVSVTELESDIIKILNEGMPMEKVSISCVGVDDETPDSQIEMFFNIIGDCIN